MTATGLRVKLLGNHSHVHGGCRAVWEMMRRETTRQGASIVEQGNYDVLVVNGEGSMHHGAPTYRKKMAALSAAVAAGKPAFLINTVWQDNPHDDDEVLQALNGVVVREPLSQAAISRHGVNAHVKPDLSWFFHEEPGGPFTDLHNAVVVTDFFSHDFLHFARPTAGPLAAYPYFDFCAHDWMSAINSLKTAKLLVTGRQHAVYAACRARTPFLAVKGNSHKIEGLVAMAGADIPLLDSPHEIPAALPEAEARRAEYDRLFDWLEAQSLAGAFPDFATMSIPA